MTKHRRVCPQQARLRGYWSLFNMNLWSILTATADRGNGGDTIKCREVAEAKLSYLQKEERRKGENAVS